VVFFVGGIWLITGLLFVRSLVAAVLGIITPPPPRRALVYRSRRHASALVYVLIGSRRVDLSGGVLACLERGADLHMAQMRPLLLTVSCFSKIQIGFYLPCTSYKNRNTCFRLTRVVPNKGPSNGCVCMLGQ